MFQNKVAIVFNGPPGSGKDAICDHLVGKLAKNGYKHLRFKDKLFELAMTIYSISEKDFFDIYNDRDMKEQPLDIFYGRSARQVLIHISEVMIKPEFGKNYFGVAAAKTLVNGINVFSDGGFPEELEGIYEATNGHMLIVQLFRDGCDFSNDSRNYINNFKDVPIVKVDNNGTLDDFFEKVKIVIQDKFEQTSYYSKFMQYEITTHLKDKIYA